MRFRALAGALLVAVAAACTTTEPSGTSIEQTKFADTLHIDLTKFTKLTSGMYVRDSIIGTGKALVAGDSVSTHYIGDLANATTFDSNLPGQTPFGVRIGAGQVIPGFEIGLQGMQPGGKRIMLIPSELGYGAASVGPIPAYSVLVFIVDAVSVFPAAP